MKTYRVVRFYERDGEPARVIKTGLTLAEAQAHCRDPETSSNSAVSVEAQQHSIEHGSWFDGYETEV